ncbi:FecR family protein [Mucilaginibacter pocheonensis]|uniref:FecR family protein n=1 Tax=Mucilaginibacter pocheonensis TaxID=398050 RepID=A0ABU1T768_9SPHI|nr:FecR domain-containing protein [Mucilaginibacter pocheonensis]MDR6941143.1 hypothetical protein [Mucilaginibacter pocheonensis]
MEKNERDFYVAELISKLLTGDITLQEHLWLKKWIDESAANRTHFEKLADPDHLQKKLDFWDTIDTEEAWGKLESKLQPDKKTTHFNYLSLLKYAAVAILILSVSILLFRQNRPVKKTNGQPIAHNLIHPGSKHAILILGNGQKVVLKKHEQLAINENDGTAVSNHNNVLAYKNDEQTNTGQKLIYNTIVVPRGGEYQLILADGSKIWMNSASTLRYPTSFSGKERRVYLTGEAYFEVAKNAQMPFIVKTNKAEVQVLGTHFNVMSYEDEADCKTTLLEGAVRVQSSTAVNVIKPGQQAITSGQGRQEVTSKVDVDEEIAWKSGLFIFKNADIKNIMQQASRWYDFDVVYKGEVPEFQFTGRLSRRVDFSGFTNILKYAGLNFTIKGKTVIITK